MPNRALRESALTSSSLARLSHGAERFFFRLTLVADDFGRFESEPMVLLARCFPVMLDRVKVADITRWWAELVAESMVASYCVGGKRYAYFPSWDKHQDRRAKHSKHPDPLSADACAHVADTCGTSAPENRESRSEVRESRSEKREAPQSRLPAVLSDGQFLDQLRVNPAYTGIDLERELAKMDAFLLTPRGRGRRKTKQFIVNWLNRIDRPISAASDPGAGAKPLGATAQTAANPDVVTRALERARRAQ